MPVTTPSAARRARFAAESPVALTRRARRIHRALLERYPYAHCELDFETPLQLLVATVLSAQTTDVMVNTVTPHPVLALAHRRGARRRRPRGDGGRAAADRLLPGQDQLGDQAQRRASSSGSTARCRAGSTDLVTLPGVGRKTANVVLGNAFGVPGITVDTHFGRLVRRFGWTDETDPVKVEHAIGAMFPKRDWTMLSHVLIFHGRRTCHAKKPACGACPVAAWCPQLRRGRDRPASRR